PVEVGVMEPDQEGCAGGHAGLEKLAPIDGSAVHIAVPAVDRVNLCPRPYPVNPCARLAARILRGLRHVRRATRSDPCCAPPSSRSCSSPSSHGFTSAHVW